MKISHIAFLPFIIHCFINKVFLAPASSSSKKVVVPNTTNNSNITTNTSANISNATYFTTPNCPALTCSSNLG